MSDRHLDEPDLVLHYYGESDAATAHLEACAECAAALRELRETLEQLPEPVVPDRDAAYGPRVWNGVQARLAAGSVPNVVPLRRRGVARAAAWSGIAAALLISFWIGRRFPSASVEPVVRERVLLVVVGDHLERSRMVLAEISNAAVEGEVDFRSQQQRAGSIAAEGRLVRQAALRAGDTAVAGVLEEIERVLVEVANGPERLSQRQLKVLRERIDARGLVFKTKVVESQVRARTRRATAGKEISL